MNKIEIAEAFKEEAKIIHSKHKHREYEILSKVFIKIDGLWQEGYVYKGDTEKKFCRTADNFLKFLKSSCPN